MKTALNTLKEENALKEAAMKGKDKYAEIGKTKTKDVEEELVANTFTRN